MVVETVEEEDIVTGGCNVSATCHEGRVILLALMFELYCRLLI